MVLSAYKLPLLSSGKDKKIKQMLCNLLYVISVVAIFFVCVCLKACPPCSLDVCALRMQLFIGLRSVCVYGRHVILLSTANTETPEESERTTQRRGL